MRAVEYHNNKELFLHSASWRLWVSLKNKFLCLSTTHNAMNNKYKWLFSFKFNLKFQFLKSETSHNSAPIVVMVLQKNINSNHSFVDSLTHSLTNPPPSNIYIHMCQLSSSRATGSGSHWLFLCTYLNFNNNKTVITDISECNNKKKTHTTPPPQKPNSTIYFSSSKKTRRDYSPPPMSPDNSGGGGGEKSCQCVREQ